MVDICYSNDHMVDYVYFIVRDEFILWWIMPHTNYLKAGRGFRGISAEKMRENIKNKYENITVIPVIEKLLTEKFGDDISRIMLDFFVAIQLTNTEKNFDS